MSTLSRADLESIHRFSSRNRALLAQSKQAGCFYCQSLFDPAEMMDWVDAPQHETGDTADGITALCPRCGIDAVLPSAAVVLGKQMLAEMNAHWFSAL
ncbi:MAG: cytoplasmic protein [Gemmatimonadaceae bacterium]